MTTERTAAMHPSLLRTTTALEEVGARQQRNALPATLQTVIAIGLSVAAIAALALG